MRELQLKARAKINLGLDVIRRREDGYHEVRMIMQTVNLYDRITLRRTEEPGIRVKTNLPYLPVNGDNLVCQAAKLLMDEFHVPGGLDIDLKKRIPVAAGMAGGSSDAAAVLVGVNQMYQLGLGRRALMKRGVRIGADVPFCVLRGTALAEGIGEKLTPLPAMPHCFLVVVMPHIHVSTKFVYGNLKLGELREHPDIDRQIADLRRQDLEALAAHMGNVLETVTVPAYPVLEELKKAMRDYGALGTMMSGSGPTIFGVFEQEGKAEDAFRLLKKHSAVRQVFLLRQ